MAMRQRPDEREDEFVLTLRPEARYVSTARAFAASIARHFRCDEERVQDLKVAVSEACSNAIKAHLRADVAAPVRLVVRWERSRLLCEVIDSGGGFEPSAFDGLPIGPSGPLFESGIGLMLIKALFPGTQITRNDSGMSVRFEMDLTEAVS